MRNSYTKTIETRSRIYGYEAIHRSYLLMLPTPARLSAPAQSSIPLPTQRSLFDVNCLITPPFRISFPSVFVATGYQDSPTKFGVTALWKAEDVKGKYKDSWGVIVKALDAKAREFFDTPLARLPANVRRGIRNGNEKSHLNGYGEGILFASLSTDRKPQVVDLSKVIIPDGDTARIYPGAWARASVNVYAYDNIGKGVALGSEQCPMAGPRRPTRLRDQCGDSTSRPIPMTCGSSRRQRKIRPT